MSQEEHADRGEIAWGTLPVEKYILQKWDRSSALSLEEQRRELVLSYIAADEMDHEPLSQVERADGNMQELIRSVLVPWRPQKLRLIAMNYINHAAGLFDQFTVLRTYYGGGSADDEKLSGWLEEADPYDETFGGPDEKWWQVLDDAALFDMGEEDWQGVYDSLPELAAPRSHRGFDAKKIEDVRNTVADLWGAREEEPEEDDFENFIMDAARIGPYLLIVDKQAFEEGEFGLVYRDANGNIVREGTLKPEDLDTLLVYQSRGALSESEYWLDTNVGKKYRPRGKIMRRVLPAVMENED